MRVIAQHSTWRELLGQVRSGEVEVDWFHGSTWSAREHTLTVRQLRVFDNHRSQRLWEPALWNTEVPLEILNHTGGERGGIQEKRRGHKRRGEVVREEKRLLEERL